MSDIYTNLILELRSNSFGNEYFKLAPDPDSLYCEFSLVTEGGGKPTELIIPVTALPSIIAAMQKYYDHYKDIVV